MIADFSDADESKVVKELKKIVGALNARGLGDDNNPVMIKLATLEADVKHLQAGFRELKTMLWAVVAGVLGLILKMVIEGAVR